MRKLKLVEHITLDGIIQVSGAPGDEFPYGDWSAKYRSPAGLAMVLEIYGEKFDLLLGRKTYDAWSGFWPKAPASPMGDRLNAATKYVVTHRPESLSWGPFEGITDLVNGVRAIKEKGGPDIVLSGSSTLTSTLIEHGLADEVVMLVNPVLMGQGKRFFAQGTPARELVFQTTKVSPTGILINSYKVAEPIPKQK